MTTQLPAHPIARSARPLFPERGVAHSPATKSAVLITASEPEPRTFGKQVVLGGLLDHLCDRLGPENVQVVLIGRDRPRPQTPYRLQLIESAGLTEQVRAGFGRVLLPPRSTLQEAAVWSARICRELQDRLTQIGADLEIWDTMRTGQYARALATGRDRDLERAPGNQRQPRRVLYADDLFSKRYATMLERIRQDPENAGNPLGEFGNLLPKAAGRIASQRWICRQLLGFEQRRSVRSEDRAPDQFDATILVNPAETAELRLRSGNNSVETLLPLLAKAAPTQKRARTFDGSATFVFVGGLNFPPNADGLRWFLRSCREEVLTALPNFRLLLVGRGTDQPLPDAAAWGDHVRPLGWVDDLDSVFGSAAGMLSPLRIGSGIKIKVLEALARGLPVIATPHGVLGLEVTAADGCLIGETPAELASNLRLATDPERNLELSQAASRCWQRSYAPAVASIAYDRLLRLPAERQSNQA